jgi:hypothetical protein
MKTFDTMSLRQLANAIHEEGDRAIAHINRPRPRGQGLGGIENQRTVGGLRIEYPLLAKSRFTGKADR